MHYLCFFLNGNNTDSKLRADHTANTTAGALIITAHNDSMIPFTINLSGLAENMLRTKLNAEATTLAPFCYHINLAAP